MEDNKEEEFIGAESELNRPTESDLKEEAEFDQEDQPKESKEELDELGQAKAEISELKDKHLRLYSEFENFRRRSAKERLELIQTASSDLVVKLLEVMDDFERAQRSNAAVEEGSARSILQGFELVQNKFSKILKDEGLKKMEALEQDFNPDLHEALAKIPAPNKKLKGKVVDVVEDGYLLNEKIIRFAKVVIGE